jgi:hypothetical protein
MCTMIVQKVPLEGFGKGTDGWFDMNQANVCWDHPFHAPAEHALNIDFVNEGYGPSARVAVELSVDSARQLVETIQSVLAEAESKGVI